MFTKFPIALSITWLSSPTMKMWHSTLPGFFYHGPNFRQRQLSQSIFSLKRLQIRALLPLSYL
jgi:hypothetical protein